MNDKLLSLLGLCRRAGKLTIGCDSVIESVNCGETQLVLFVSNASQNTRKTVLNSVADKVKIITLNHDKETVSASLGRLCAVAGVNDKGFAKKLLQLLENNNGEECNLC